MGLLKQDDEYLLFSYIKEYNTAIEKIKIDSTDEILETLKEIEYLNEIYDRIVSSYNTNLIPTKEDFHTFKQKLLKDRIKRKIDKYIYLNEKNELFKSLIDELNYCKKRYKNYEKIINVEILKIENMII